MQLSAPDRLASALNANAPEDLRGDRKAFQRLMRERFGEGNRKGTSYPAVLGYFKGSASPSLAWIEVAAGILGVLPAWLAYGVGERTQADQKAADIERAVVSMSQDQTEEWQRMGRRIMTDVYCALEVPEWAEDARGIPYWVGGLANLEVQRGLSPRRVARTLAAALSEAGFPAGEMGPRDVSYYIMSMIQVLTGLSDRKDRRHTAVRTANEREEMIRRALIVETSHKEHDNG